MAGLIAGTICGLIFRPQTGGTSVASYTLNCPSPITGTYVSVQQPGPGRVLSLSQVLYACIRRFHALCSACTLYCLCHLSHESFNASIMYYVCHVFLMSHLLHAQCIAWIIFAYAWWFHGFQNEYQSVEIVNISNIYTAIMGERRVNVGRVHVPKWFLTASK